MVSTGRTLRVREVSADEMNAVADVTRAAYQEFATVMDRMSWEGLREAVEEGLRRHDEAETIVAELEGEIVGSVMLFAPQTATYGGAVAPALWPEIRLLAVAPAARGKGIARELLFACLERVRRRGFGSVGLHTSKSMQIAVEMYRAMGFVRAPEFDFQPAGAELVEAYVLHLA